MRIGVVGFGVVGSNTGRCLKERGHAVCPLDPPKGLGTPELLAGVDAAFICVPSPAIDNDRFVLEAIELLPTPTLVCIRSTVLPGTTERLERHFHTRGHRMVFVPEFLSEATAWEDTCFPSRKIVGFTKQSKKDCKKLLDLLPSAPYEAELPARVAEMVKYFSNAFYALKVAYSNQMYDLCQALDIDYDKVKKAAAEDPMIGPTHLEVLHKGYRGFGGKCLPKDVRALLELSYRAKLPLSVLSEAETYNEGFFDPNEYMKLLGPWKPAAAPPSNRTGTDDAE